MKNEPKLKVIHRQPHISHYTPEEIYRQLSEVKEDLQAIITLLDHHLDVDTSNFSC